MRKGGSLLLVCMIAVLPVAQAKTPRSSSEIAAFKRANPCPSNGARQGPCPGYVIDHIIPLFCGGPDALGNMQYQTIEEGKAKDKWERKQCEHKLKKQLSNQEPS